MKKDPAAVTLGRKGGLKGGVARAARMTPEQRSASASNAVRARGAKAGKQSVKSERVPESSDPSDSALLVSLKHLRVATDIDEINRLSEQIERIVFHKQFENA